MIIYESKTARTEFDSSIQCITWTGNNFISSEDFQNSFQNGVNFVIQRNQNGPTCTSWLNDTRKVKGANPSDILWLNKNVNDPGKQYGVTKIAFVLPEDVFGRLSVRTYIFMTRKRKDLPQQIKTFETIEEAKLWLKGKP
jgi:hypothetical protein